MDRIYILAIAIVIAGALSGGLYTAAGGNGSGYVINRFTGSGWYCGAMQCFRLNRLDVANISN
jgi:hypothetical protein